MDRWKPSCFHSNRTWLLTKNLDSPPTVKCTEMPADVRKINRAKARNSLTLCKMTKLWKLPNEELITRQNNDAFETACRQTGSFLHASCRRAAWENWSYNVSLSLGMRARNGRSSARALPITLDLTSAKTLLYAKLVQIDYEVVSDWECSLILK